MKAASFIAAATFVATLATYSSVAMASVDTKTSDAANPETVTANLTLDFSEPCDLEASVVEVRDDFDRIVSTGQLRYGDDRSDVLIPLVSPLQPGMYTIR